MRLSQDVDFLCLWVIQSQPSIVKLHLSLPQELAVQVLGSVQRKVSFMSVASMEHAESATSAFLLSCLHEGQPALLPPAGVQ